MSPIVKELRQAAKCAPLWKTIFEAAADKIERLQEDNNKIRGRMHDQWINQNKVKADAVLEAMKLVVTTGCGENKTYIDGFTECDDQWEKKLTDIANKIKRGEL